MSQAPTEEKIDSILKGEDESWPRASDWIAGKYNSLADGISSLGIVGAPLNASITPGRTDQAPQAIRAALERFSLFDIPHNNDLRIIKVEDVGDLDIGGKSPEQAVQSIADAIRKFRDSATPTVMLGGDNSVTRAGVHGLKCSLDRTGLITFDAHFDVRDTSKGLNNGNPIRALLEDGLAGPHIIQIGVQSFANAPDHAKFARDANVNYVPVEQVWEDGIERTMRDAFEHLRDLDGIYLNLDLDVLDRVYAPACPGSRPGGLLPWQVRQMAYLCGCHYNIAAMDLVEIDPTKDIADVTCLMAAACLLSFASGTLERRERK